MFVVPTQPQTTWQVLQSGFGLWKSTFRFVWPFSISFATINAIYDYYNLTPASSQDHSARISALLIGFLSVWIHAAIIDGIHRARGQKAYHYLPWNKMLRKTWVFFMVSFLTGFMLIAGSLCFIVPGIILSIYVIFSPYLAIIDESGITESIHNSFRLTAKYWWFLANRLTFLSLIILLFLIGVFFIISVFFIVTNTTVWTLTLSTNVKIIVIPVVWFLNALLYPLGHAFMLETLYDLRLRKASPSA